MFEALRPWKTREIRKPTRECFSLLLVFEKTCVPLTYFRGAAQQSGAIELIGDADTGHPELIVPLCGWRSQ